MRALRSLKLHRTKGIIRKQYDKTLLFLECFLPIVPFQVLWNGNLTLKERFQAVRPVELPH